MQTCYVEGFGVFDGHWSDSKKTNSTLEIKEPSELTKSP